MKTITYNELKALVNASSDYPILGCRIHIGPIGTNRGIGFTVKQEPTNRREWIELLEETIRALKANEIETDVEDFDVLGKYSPKTPVDL